MFMFDLCGLTGLLQTALNKQPSCYVATGKRKAQRASSRPAVPEQPAEAVSSRRGATKGECPDSGCHVEVSAQHAAALPGWHAAAGPQPGAAAAGARQHHAGTASFMPLLRCASAASFAGAKATLVVCRCCSGCRMPCSRARQRTWRSAVRRSPWRSYRVQGAPLTF